MSILATVLFAVLSASLVLRARTIARGFTELADRMPDHPASRVLSAVLGTAWHVRFVGVLSFLLVILMADHSYAAVFVADLGFLVLVAASWLRWRQGHHRTD